MDKEQKKVEDLVSEVGVLPAIIANTQAYYAVPYKYRAFLYDKCAEYEGITAVGESMYRNCFKTPQTSINEAFQLGERASAERWKIRVTAMVLALIDTHNQILVDLQTELNEQEAIVTNTERGIEYVEAELRELKDVLSYSKRQVSVRKERKTTIETVLKNSYLDNLNTENNE